MKEIENTLKEFIRSFNISTTKDLIPFKGYDANYIGNWGLHDLLRDMTTKYSKEVSPKPNYTMALGAKLANKLNDTDRIMILWYFLEHIYNKASSVLEFQRETMSLHAAKSLGFDLDELKTIRDFFLNSNPLSDVTGAAYFVDKNHKLGLKTICRNVIYCSDETITYVKYLDRLNILLSKTYKRNTDYSFREDYHEGNIRIITEKNFNRSDFSYYSYNEVVELITNFNPLQFYDFAGQSNMPSVLLDPNQKKIVIAGNSFPLPQSNFFGHILEWLTRFRKSSNTCLDINIDLNNFNTYTSRFLVYLTKECRSMVNDGFEINLKVYYDEDDEDMKEFGIHLLKIFKNGIAAELYPRDSALAS